MSWVGWLEGDRSCMCCGLFAVVIVVLTSWGILVFLCGLFVNCFICSLFVVFFVIRVPICLVVLCLGSRCGWGFGVAGKSLDLSRLSSVCVELLYPESALVRQWWLRLWGLLLRVRRYEKFFVIDVGSF